ncbi:MAG: NapC/NirT family cytochrome c [Clostridia bacterium]|jgi:nitrate/TMAO reductase-like tetraheme cytochrome c subunit|nr:NapC/NirT family cytochrome c [Clostridia bacterium]
MKRLTIWLLLPAFFIIFLPISYYVTSKPSFCRSCHYIESYVNSWTASAHQEVKCLFCHESRGTFGKVHSKTRGLNHVTQHVSGNYTKAIKGWVDERNCIACHLNEMRGYPGAPNLKELANHQTYLEQIFTDNTLCIDCHSEAGHQRNLNSF